MNTTIHAQLEGIGLAPDDIVLVHSSFKSLGLRDPEEIIGALIGVIGEFGTLLMPALSYRQVPSHVHETHHTPTCVGFLTEYFRNRAGTVRSLHPTHSVCAVGARSDALTADHWRNSTPCGANSPFNRLIEVGGKILMIGCGLRPMTTMHAVEEHVAPPYLFGPEREYTLTDRFGRTFRKGYRTHGFAGFRQRYDRIESLLLGGALRTGRVGSADCFLIDAAALHRVGVARMREDPFNFVESIV